MFSWLEQRVKLKDFFIRPLLPRGISSWSYFPGVFAVILLIFQLISGAVLAFTYMSEAAVDDKVLSVFWRNAHWLGADLLLLVILLHFLCKLYHGSYRRPREFIWLGGMMLFLIIGLAFVTGYVLPDNLQAKQTIAFSKQLADKMPVVGDWFIDLLQLNSENPDSIRRRCYVVHVSLIPIATILLLIAHLWFLQRAAVAADSKQ